MSFNLNKGEEPAKKTSFDLSKNEAADLNKTEKISGTWVYFLLAFLAVCGLAWYFTLHRSTASSNSPEINQAKSEVPVTDTLASPLKPPTPPETVAILAASFRSGSVVPERLSKKTLLTLQQKIKKSTLSKIMVFGYASSEGEQSVNQRISQARAEGYKKQLMANGVAEARIIAQGKGVENPIATNDTEPGRKKNRRVEVIIQ